MKKLLTISLFAAASLVFAQQRPPAPPKPTPAPKAEAAKPKEPTPIPADQHEAISRQMISLQATQLTYNDARQKYIEAAKDFEAAKGAWEKTISELQAKHNAPSCSINLDKTWACPQQAAPTPPPQ